jgi:hypothetical protein
MTDFDTYNVVLLIERSMSNQDAAQVRSLHESLDQPVRYHLLVPLEDAAAQVEAAMGTLTAGDMIASPAMTMSDVDLDEVRRDCQERSDSDLNDSLDRLQATGATCDGVVAGGSPISALANAVKKYDAQEAIILTRPHVVAEFFHVDWTSKARRKLGVPVLHLLEHENFDEQAGGSGEGVTGL